MHISLLYCLELHCIHHILYEDSFYLIQCYRTSLVLNEDISPRRALCFSLPIYVCFVSIFRRYRPHSVDLEDLKAHARYRIDAAYMLEIPVIVLLTGRISFLHRPVAKRDVQPVDALFGYSGKTYGCPRARHSPLACHSLTCFIRKPK